MKWFKKKTQDPIVPELIAPPIADAKERAAIQIVANKDARAEVVEQTKVANKHLRDLVEGNNFTVTIFIAAGGKQPKTRSSH